MAFRPAQLDRVSESMWNELHPDSSDSRPNLGHIPGQSGRQPSIIRIMNNTGNAVDRYGVLKITGFELSASVDDTIWGQFQPIMTGDTPDENDGDKLCILLEPSYANQPRPVRAVVDGVVQCKIDVTDEDHGWARVSDGVTANLVSAARGPVRILWTEDTSGVTRAVVRLTGSSVSLIQVDLTQTGGSQGTSTASPTWTYTVTDTETGDELDTNVDPTVSPHQWARHIGQMNAASAGIAAIKEDGTFALLWINEQTVFEACDQQGLLTVT